MRPREELALQKLFLVRIPFVLKNLRLFVRTTGKVRVERRVISFGQKGQSDMYGMWDGGAHIELEAKAHGGTLSPEQLTWRAWCHEHRVSHLVLQERKGDEQVTTVDRWIEEVKAIERI